MTPDYPVRDTCDCLPVPAFAADDLHAVRAAFHDATAIPLTLAWLDQPEPDFLPATVRTGWQDQTLYVFATMADADIFTRATHHHQRFWELGDTFEILLQPSPDAPYVELHVTPNNLRLQLRFAAPPEPGADLFDQALIRDEVFHSRAWVHAPAREWNVLAAIPAALVRRSPGSTDRWSLGASAPGSLADSHWRVSFCRYDYTRGRARPVISSSSLHTEPRFHRPHEWNELRFKRG